MTRMTAEWRGSPSGIDIIKACRRPKRKDDWQKKKKKENGVRSNTASGEQKRRQNDSSGRHWLDTVEKREHRGKERRRAVEERPPEGERRLGKGGWMLMIGWIAGFGGKWI